MISMDESQHILKELSGIRSEVSLLKIKMDSLERIFDFQRRLDELNRPDRFLEEAAKSESLIQKNFEEWRDYLHKYSIVMMSITAFFTTLVGSNLMRVEPDWSTVYWSFGFIGTSVLLALLSIFITIFVERKIINARVLFALPGRKRDERINPIDGRKMDYRDSIEECKQKLKQETDPDEIKWLKLRIKADKRGLRLMKYVAAPVGWYESVRLWMTVLMLGMSFIGIVIMMSQFLRSSNNESMQQVETQETDASLP
ncbi:MAG: hypothetical protein UY85_C0029G0032 [Candidatus Peribacteria bacterium GW2011_GWB1_54_5]|nr:MAG: hypothetical protein UY85_C0029G0032 [Candidatus Peribacteria bacterium GW2011_GWB1_54_5]KKW40776.1 MAG: hypothetical protein UY90_C0072G0009 [Candidatus Peregrinibacteria bacterium GW2011_GWA2_54_9]